MKNILLALIISFSITPTVLCAQPTAFVVKGPGEFHGGQLCAYYADSMTLLVINGGKTIVRHFFCSSQPGLATTANLVQDRLGNYYILLKYWTGRDLGVNLQEYLEVFRLPRKLNQLKPTVPNYEYLRVPILGGAGPESQWAYRYRIDKPECGGLRFVFTRSILGSKKGILFMPEGKTRNIEINGRVKCSH
ncbi:MAG: hypothetical protein WCC11_02225 [Gammaproteobacteria bacterium]